jgi:hypothetical protein
MGNLYSWTMRNSAQILFGLALFIFVIGLGQAFAELRNAASQASLDGMPGMPVSQGAVGLLMAISGIVRAATSAVLPLAAAAALYRWDRHAKIQ